MNENSAGLGDLAEQLSSLNSVALSKFVFLKHVVWLAHNHKEYGCGWLKNVAKLIPKLSIAISEFRFLLAVT